MYGISDKFIKWLFPANYIYVLNFLLLRCNSKGKRLSETFFSHPFLDLKCVIREDFILKCCNGKRVLHLGFIDSPLTAEKIKAGTLLHTRLRTVADYIYGIDIDENSINEYRSLTGDYDNCAIEILQGNSDLSFVKDKFDLILFPEILEHLPNPGMALLRLKEICLLNSGCQLLITVPNAFSLQHFTAASNKVELVHSDHYYYFSPFTLKKLIKDSGFSHVDIKLYAHDHKALKTPGITNQGIIALSSL